MNESSASPRQTDEQEHPHACMDGYVYLGVVRESDQDLDGEVIEYERIPCRRCAEAAEEGTS